MPSEPSIQLLSKQHRARFFWILVGVFLVSMPLMIFYTTGYRLSFVDDTATIVTTGGLYVSTTESVGIEVLVDEGQVLSPRLFRSAYYVQNVVAGKRRVVVQGPSVQTWVKDLPVDPYLVTEAAAFTLPKVPQVRPVTPYLSATTSLPIVFASTSTNSFSTVSSTAAYELVASSTATTSLVQSSEYEFMRALFGTSTEPLVSVLSDEPSIVESFQFASEVVKSTSTTATSTSLEREYANMRLYEEAGEIYATWTGEASRIPYYFCVQDSHDSRLVERYGTHVAEQIAALRLATTSTMLTSSSDRICRPSIRIDRKWQPVFGFDFVPGQRDLVLLHLADGLYVVEIDDRAWQNVQLLYPGDTLRYRIFGGQIYVTDGVTFFALSTTIESS